MGGHGADELRRLAVDGHGAQARRELSTLLAGTDDPGECCDLQTEVAFVAVMQGDYAAGLSAAQAATRLASDPDRRATAAAAEALAVAFPWSTDPTRYGEVAQLMAEALDRALAAVALAPGPSAMCHYLLAEAALSHGAPAVGEGHARLGIAACAADEPVLDLLNRKVLARAVGIQGRLQEGATELDEYVAQASADGNGPLCAMATAFLAFLYAVRGDKPSSVDQAIARAIELARPVDRSFVAWNTMTVIANVLSTLGRHEEATTVLLEGAGTTDLRRLRWTDQLYGYRVLIEAALAAGDPSTAATWLERMEQLPHAGFAIGLLEAARARVAHALGQSSDELEAGMRASEAASRHGEQLEAARARVATGAALARAGERQRALQELERVARQTEEFGAGSIRANAVRELRRLGERYRADSGWPGLTERERAVARMAAAGRTNREIAAELFISERTVQSHLEAAHRALGLSSRTQLPVALAGLEQPVVADVLDGGQELTERQWQVIDLVGSGLSNGEVAAGLGVSVKTVEKHLSEVYRRLGVSNRTGLTAFWQAHRSQRAAADVDQP